MGWRVYEPHLIGQFLLNVLLSAKLHISSSGHLFTTEQLLSGEFSGLWFLALEQTDRQTMRHIKVFENRVCLCVCVCLTIVFFYCPGTPVHNLSHKLRDQNPGHLSSLPSSEEPGHTVHPCRRISTYMYMNM